MLDGLRVSSAVSSITNQKYAADPHSDFKNFARQMADKIMASYRDDSAELQGLSIRRKAVRLTTEVLIELEYEYEACVDADDDDSNAAEILTTIEWLRECLLDFGQMYGEQIYVAECLALHEKVLHGLLGNQSKPKTTMQDYKSSESYGK